MNATFSGNVAQI